MIELLSEKNRLAVIFLLIGFFIRSCGSGLVQLGAEKAFQEFEERAVEASAAEFLIQDGQKQFRWKRCE